jgi:hypothetical protein
METLVLKTNGKTREFIINTNSPVAEDLINSLIDFHQPDDWFMKEGWNL